MPGKPVVVGVDGSPESARAAAFAWRLAQVTRAECRLVHVIPDTWLLDHIGQPLLNSRALIDNAIRQARERLGQAMREAAGQEPLLNILLQRIVDPSAERRRQIIEISDYKGMPFAVTEPWYSSL